MTEYLINEYNTLRNRFTSLSRLYELKIEEDLVIQLSLDTKGLVLLPNKLDNLDKLHTNFHDIGDKPVAHMTCILKFEGMSIVFFFLIFLERSSFDLNHIKKIDGRFNSHVFDSSGIHIDLKNLSKNDLMIILLSAFVHRISYVRIKKKQFIYCFRKEKKL